MIDYDRHNGVWHVEEMTKIAVLSVADPFRFRDGNGECLGFRACDLCDYSNLYDIWANRDWRTLYMLQPDRICVCDECLPELEFFWES